MKKINRIKLLVLILTGCVPALVSAQQQSSRILSLKETLQVARGRDIRLVLSQERVTQALARIGQNRSVLLPQIDADSFYRRQTRDLRTSGMSFSGDPLVGPFNSFDARAQLTQTIFDPAAVSRLRSAQAGHDLSWAELRKTREDVLALVVTMYVEARRAAQSMEYAKTVIAREEQKLMIAQSRFKDGIASDIEVKQAQADHDAAARFQRQALTDATGTRLDLVTALGLEPEQQIEFPDEDGIIFPSPSPEPVTADLEQLPDLRVAKEQLSVSRADRSMERSEYLPRVSALADYGLSGLKPSDTNNTYTFGLQASLPLFDGGLRRNQVKETESRVKADTANLDHTRRQVKSDIVRARESFEQAQTFVAQSVSRRAVARQQLDLVRQRRQDGTADEVELLEALAADAAAGDEEHEARATLLTAQVNWARALGKMDEISNTEERTDEVKK